MADFIYPAVFTPDEEGGGFVVTFPDVPEALTQGDTVEECLSEAVDCLEEAIAGYISAGLRIPVASKVREGQHAIQLPALMALKAAMHSTMMEVHISNVALGKKLGVNEKEVRRWRDPHHGTRLPTMERALAALGKQLVIQVR